jgi:hypothetical protein
MVKKTQALVPNQEEERKKSEAALRKLRPLVKQTLEGPPIKTDRAYQDASDARRVVVTTKDSIDKNRKKITRLLDDAKKGIMSWFKPMYEECDQALELIDEKLNSYDEWKWQQAEAEREAARKKEEKRLAILKKNEAKKLAKAESRDERLRIKQTYDEKKDVVSDESAAEQQMVDDSPPKAEGTSVRMLWDFEVLDMDQVPEEYLIYSVNKPKVLEYCREITKNNIGDHKREPKIRGLKLFQKPSRGSRRL